MLELTHLYFLGSLLIGAFVLTFMLMPRIINVVKFKRLMDKPNERSSHSEVVPSLGGVVFYIVIVLGLYFIRPFDKYDISGSLLPGLTILFFVGVKDDLMVIGPYTKLVAQLISISFLLVHPSFQISNFNNFLGIDSVSYLVSIPVSAFVMLFIINAFNLIDGIDGLASMVGIVIFSVFAVMFFFLERIFSLGICLISIGSIFAFLRFNLSTDKKIFMGDTGSLILGFLIAALTIRIFSLKQNELEALPFQLENLPLLVMSILIIPVFDTTRVFTIRLINGKTPFSADRNHIHHLMIDYLKLSHRKASFFIGLSNLFFVLLFMFLGIHLNDGLLLLAFTILILLLTYFFFRINFSYKNLRRIIYWRRKMKEIKNNSNLFGF